MHDLNTIRRLNAERHADSIRDAQAAGKHVVAHYTGLHLLSTQLYDSQADALAALARPCEAGDSRAYFPPTPAHYGRASRDQSEDRTQPFTLAQLAALGSRSIGDPEFAGAAA